MITNTQTQTHAGAYRRFHARRLVAPPSSPVGLIVYIVIAWCWQGDLGSVNFGEWLSALARDWQLDANPSHPLPVSCVDVAREMDAVFATPPLNGSAGSGYGKRDAVAAALSCATCYVPCLDQEPDVNGHSANLFATTSTAGRRGGR